jgi:hypothetical protein
MRRANGLDLAEQHLVSAFERFETAMGPKPVNAHDQGDYWRVRTNAAKVIQERLDRIGKQRMALRRLTAPTS